eukprot:Phypoly_transcript_06495.p1 GENE.Phypoly_transcript_06495~~Phypoly_transcript_06495.p1  ORF type:complete len:526 (+),score=65.18 Phypoly_transcript_06495:182-1759(+)
MGGLLVDDALPLKQVLSLCFIQLCDFINAGAIYPYIIFLVQSFSLTSDERKLGYYAGLLASSYFLAQLLSSLLWGIASDKFGRRPCLLAGLFFSMVTVVMFGFSSSLPWAIATRFLSGFLNGNVGITKTMLGEISTSATQARAFSYFGFTIGVSGIVGPLVGGSLSKPSEKYPSLFGGVSLFETYPYCLPNLIVGALSLFGLIAGFFFLPETKKWGPTETQIKMSTLFSKGSAGKQSFTKLQEVSVELSTSSTVLTLSDDVASSDDESVSDEDLATPDTKLSVRQCLDTLRRDRGVLISCGLYGFIGLMFVFYEEMSPYWAFLDLENGGLGFSSTEIGIYISIGCIIGILFQLLVYPKIANKLGILKAFRLGGFLVLPGMVLLPQVPIISVALTSNRDLGTNPLTWILLICAILFIQVGAELLFVCVMIAISNSAVPEMMGTVNGLAQTFVALTRSAAPVAGSSLLSWSLTNGLGFPLNYQFPFLVLIVMGGGVIALSLLAPPSLNIQKKEALQKEAEMLLNESL